MAAPTEKQKLLRAVHTSQVLIADSLDVLLETWTERLAPSFQSSLGSIQRRATNQEEDDDYLSEEVAVVEQSKQLVLNLYAAAIYHVLEQHLVYFFYRWGKHVLGQSPSDRPQLEDTINSFEKAWNIHPKSLSSWPVVDELRLVANCVKHGDGKACEQLKGLRPGWFPNRTTGTLPLNPFGLVVPDEYLADSVRSAKTFLADIKGEIENL